MSSVLEQLAPSFVEPQLRLGELSVIGKSFEGSKPEEVLRWAADTFGAGLAMATAFGAEGCVLLDMLAGIAPDTYVFNLETGYQFRETLDLRERIRSRYGITVDYVRPVETVEEMEARFGGPLNRTRPQLCCQLRKIEPLKRVLRGRTAWISAIRREQTPHRAAAGIVEWDAKFGLVKINPLANWTQQDVWDYIGAYDVPHNPLHHEGYPSIGCWPCTRPAAVAQGERSGRWAGLAMTECGLHTRA